MIESRWTFLGILGGLAGVAAAAVTFSMLRLLIEHGRLGPLGWCVFVVSGGLFLALWFFLSKPMDPERRQYLDLIQSTEWLTDPHELSRSAENMAMRFLEVLTEKGMEIHDPEASLPGVTQYLKENASRVLSEPELCSQAAAYYGQIFKEKFRGEWKIWRKARYADAVVRVGKGRKRHNLSPGLLVFRVARLPDVSLQGILEHEMQEMSDEVN